MVISSLGNFQNIDFETDICVITLDDNLTHTYCSKIKWEKDNYTPVGVAQLVMPFDKYISEYWSKYSGTVVVHANLKSTHKSLFMDTINNISLNLKSIQKVESKIDTRNNKIRLQNDFYNYSFIGKVNRFKQVGNTFIVYLEDLGWKFMQKVPKEFRDAYISGQKLGDAFQSICEFMGIDFAYSIDDLNQFSFSADGYSVEKDGQIVEEVSTVLSEWRTLDKSNTENTDEELANNLDNQTYENTGLSEHDKQTQSTTQSTAQSVAPLTNQSVADSTIQLQMEFDNKIKDLFIGNTIYNSNISDAVMNYSWITEKASQTTNQANNQATNQEEEEETT